MIAAILIHIHVYLMSLHANKVNNRRLLKAFKFNLGDPNSKIQHMRRLCLIISASSLALATGIIRYL